MKWFSDVEYPRYVGGLVSGVHHKFISARWQKCTLHAVAFAEIGGKIVMYVI